jgi:ABC-type bacteriocin/lantibiotic exporter with double-glycine peptidase domain
MCVAFCRTAIAVSPGNDLNVRGDDPDSIPMPTALQHTRTWQDGRHCGMNALYFFLRLHGHNVPYNVLVQEAEIDPKRGVNIETLRAIAEKHGVDIEVVQTTPEILFALTEPVILHHEYAIDRGHFEVFLGLDSKDPTRYWAVNATRCELKRPTLAQLGRTWSGYLLRRKPVRASSLLLLNAQCTIAVALLLILSLQMFRACRKRWLKPRIEQLPASCNNTSIVCEQLP